MAALEVSPKPDFIQHRLDIFDQLKAKYDEEVASKERSPIEITLPDGSTKEGKAWQTTPLEIAAGIAKSLAEKTVVARIDGKQLWDLDRPLEGSCKLELLDFEHPEGKKVFWHSSAHVFGEACERHYGCHLEHGPPTDDGFFYDMALADNKPVLPGDFPALDQVAKMAVKEKQKFERLEMSKEDLLKMFAYNKYKVHFIKTKVPDGTTTTVYRCGPLIDLCLGPHIPHTGKIKSMAILKNSSCYFLGDKDNDTLQRVYGISFPDPKQMTEYKHFLEEAAKRDHRRIGKDQELFFFHELSPGSAFWLPHGARIYNTLVEFIKEEYRKRGYSEVISPNMFNSELWKTSGHWQHYAKDMFKVEVEKETFALKPMNCPGHCLIFGSRDRSYRELPIRMADFGVLHRNEASGALTGLTRVRRFQQDDAHVFCTVDQIEDEVSQLFDFLKYVYGLFGFTFKLELSTRPENKLGDEATWDQAERMLANALNKFVPGEWEENPGDGAFYGPKIDITISDALKRRFQCATIQLDFQLPQQFKLSYRSGENVTAGEREAAPKDGPAEAAEDKDRKRPVMIHRAIMGSVERFTAILTEHFAGKWPFWLSPRQAIVVPIAATHKAYAQEVQKALWDAGIYAEADLSDVTLNKKIRNAEIAQHNFILTVGTEEMEAKSVNVRNRDDVGSKNRGETIEFATVLQKMVALKRDRRLANTL